MERGQLNVEGCSRTMTIKSMLFRVSEHAATEGAFSI
jgi:hypothetical protein